MHQSGAAPSSGPHPTRLTVTDTPDLRSTVNRTILDLRGAGPFVSVGHYRYRTAQDALPVQIHSRLFVIAFAVRSVFDFLVNGHIARVEPGDGILIPPGNAYSTGLDAQTPGELNWLVLAAPADERQARGGMPASEIVADLLQFGVTTFRSPTLTTELLTRVLMETDGGLRWSESLCTAAIDELSRALRAAEPASDPLHPALSRAVAWAVAHIDSPVTVSDLIAVSRISSTRFYELFTQAFGTSPKDYILRMKLERATELLRTSAISITDLAHLVGFASSQHFGTAFRRYYGTSPSAYRAQATRQT